MSQRYTFNVGTAASDRIYSVNYGGEHSAIHLSDGTLVMAYFDAVAGNNPLVYSSDHVGINTIATLAGSNISHVFRDASDNLYVVQPSGANCVVTAFAKGVGYAWTQQGYSTFTPAGAQVSEAFGTWCNTGGGTGAGGHAVVLAPNDNQSTQTSPGYGVLDVGAMLAAASGASVAAVSTGRASWLPTAFGQWGLTLSNDGFGAVSGLSFYFSGCGSWSVTNTGVLTGSAIAAAAITGGTRATLIRIASGVWALAATSATTNQVAVSRWSATAQLTAPTDYGAVTNWPAMGGFAATPQNIAWDATWDGVKLWLYGWSTGTATIMLRLGCAVASGVVWDAVATTDDSGVGTGINTTIRAVNQPTSATIVDWQTFNNNAGTYALLGDYSSFQAPPFAPTLVTPANGTTVDLASGAGFAWNYNAQAIGDTQTNWAMRRKIGGGAYEYWNLSALAWQGTIVWNAGTSSSYTFAAGKWTNGNTYSYSVATQDQGGQGPFASDFAVVAANAPTVSVTSPTGTAVTTQPTVRWTGTFGAGLAQTNYRVIVYNSAQYSGGGFTPGTTAGDWDSGVVADALATSRQSGLLANGTAYRAYVQITETGALVSAWAYAAFTVFLSAPATPTLAASYSSLTDGVTLSVGARDNLLTTNQASLETDITGWAALTNCSITRANTRGIDGSSSLRLASTAAGSMSATTPVGTAGFAVTPTASYTVIAYFQTAAAGRSVSVGVNWYNAAGTLLSGTTASVTEGGGWTPAALSAIAPDTAAFGAVVVSVVAATGTLASPTGLTVTPTGTAGTTTYGYRISALNANGETLAGTELATTTGNATLTGAHYNALAWTAVPGATSYNVYGRTINSELKMVNVAGTTYNDTGVATPSGALPGSNTTAELHYVDEIGIMPGGNLLTANQASIETDASGWASDYTAPARSTAQAVDGIACLALTANAGGNSDAFTTPINGIAVTAGQTYTAVMSVRAATIPRTGTMRVQWQNNIGGNLTPTDVPVTDSITAWTQVTSTSAAPAGAVSCYLAIIFSGQVAGEVHYIDASSVMLGTSTTWVPGYYWTRGGLSGLTTALVQYSDDGVTWAAVRNGGALAIAFPAQVATLVDYEAKPNRRYKAALAANV